jgi:uncharacterized membrane protein YdbT with pleckstrin-like domain
MAELLPSGGLAPHERLLWSSTSSALYYHRRLTAAAALLITSLVFVFFPLLGPLLLFPLSFPLYILSVLLGLSARASASAHRYFITSSRLIEEHLRLGRRVNEAPLQAVAKVELSQGIMGRMLGYGNLTFMLTGGGSLIFRGIRRPELARQAFISPKQAYGQLKKISRAA